jgi:ATP-binding cassette subfamily B protein
LELSSTKQILLSYWTHVRKYPFLWFGLLLLMPIGIFINNFAQPYIVAQIIDKLSAGAIPQDQVWDQLGKYVILFVLAAATGELVVWRIIVWFTWSLEKKVSFDLYQMCFIRLSSQSATFHSNSMGGSLVSQTNKYVMSYAQLLNTAIWQITPLISILVFTFIILTPRAPYFVLGLTVLCIAFMTISILSFKKIRPLNENEAVTNNKLSGLIADMVTNIMAVKSFGREEMELRNFETANNHAQTATHKVMKGILARDLSFATVLLVGSILIMAFMVGGPAWFGMSIGTLVLISTYSFTLIGRLWEFNNILRQSNRALGNAAAMTTIINSGVDIKDPVKPLPAQFENGTISFNNVTFSHADAKDSLLFKDFNLTVKAGEHIGLVGHSGSGKTTLTKLLLRFSDINQGTIEINGRDIRKVKQVELRQRVAYVPQEPLLFHRTIEENIAYGNPRASVEEIRRAAERARAWDFIKELPYGMGTVVGERGAKLSGGQRQRIAIARAMLKEAPIILLDEATSALDSKSEKLIQIALDELMKGKTAIVIAHRLSTIQAMDRIVVLEKGQIVEQGSHEKLVQNQGPYAQLWAHQSGAA